MCPTRAIRYFSRTVTCRDIDERRNISFEKHNVSVRGAVRSQSTRKLLQGRNTFLASAVGQLNRYQCGRRNLDPHSCNFASNRFSARSRLLSNDLTATQLAVRSEEHTSELQSPM